MAFNTHWRFKFTHRFNRSKLSAKQSFYALIFTFGLDFILDDNKLIDIIKLPNENWVTGKPTYLVSIEFQTLDYLLYIILTY